MSVALLRPRAALAAALCAVALAAAALAQASPADSTVTPPPPPIQLRVAPPAPCALDTVQLVAANTCYPCFEITFLGRMPDGRIRLEFNEMSPAACSTLPCGPQERRLLLGRFAAGHHEIAVDVVWHTPVDSLGGAVPRTYERHVAFDVVPCGPKGLPFVSHTFIGAIPECDSCPPRVCPDQPVLVGLQGALPNSCWSLLGFDVLPLTSPLDRPVARLTVREGCGDSTQCPPNPNPFSVGTSLGLHAPGPHEVEIQVAVKSCTDSTAMRIFSQVFGYVVKDSCGPPPPPPAACAWPFLEPARRAATDSTNAVRCDLRLQPGGRGALVFASRSQGVPLAGLQGELGASPFLHVENLEAVGAAAGMRLDWTKKDNGASFVLYSGGGRTIPAEDWMGVLRVTVSADSGLHGDTGGEVHGTISAASDSNGTTVPICPIMTLVLPAAHVCVSEPASCDANGDGVSNVADLVRMVRCLHHPEDCPDTVAARPDCNHDGAFHLDDVFCCARAILGGPPPGSGRPPGNLSFAFGSPVVNGTTVTVPLHVRGAGDLAGALLRIDYPGDRWTALDPAVVGGVAAQAGGAGEWTPLVEIGTDDVLVGVLRLDPTAPEDMTVNLPFALKPGAEPGGELRVGSSDVTASDGTPIAIDLGALHQPLAVSGATSVPAVALSAARPNPTSGATSFVVSLPAAGNVDLAMYDLAGRRVATLHRGVLEAGERTFTWQPGASPSGVYFARLSVDGVVRSSRVTLRVSK